MQNNKVEIEYDVLDELVDIALEHEECPDVYVFHGLDDTEDCPGRLRGISCEECWHEYIEEN